MRLVVRQPQVCSTPTTMIWRRRRRPLANICNERGALVEELIGPYLFRVEQIGACCGNQLMPGNSAHTAPDITSRLPRVTSGARDARPVHIYACVGAEQWLTSTYWLFTSIHVFPHSFYAYFNGCQTTRMSVDIRGTGACTPRFL